MTEQDLIDRLSRISLQIDQLKADWYASRPRMHGSGYASVQEFDTDGEAARHLATLPAPPTGQRWVMECCGRKWRVVLTEKD